MPDSPKRVVIVNANYPPRTGVTGESACRLAARLESQHNIDVVVVSTRSEYVEGESKLKPVGDVRLIHSWYDGKNKLLRFFSSFFASFFLIRAARKINSDHVIVMTDPPFLQFWASLLLAGTRPWTLWAMDIFPDAFVSGNLVTADNFAYRLLNKLTYRNAPDSVIALGPQQAEFLRDRYLQSQQLISDTVIIPCGVYQKDNEEQNVETLLAAPFSTPAWRTENFDKIILGYCGNLGEAHSVEFLKQIINHLDEAKFHLVLAVYGVNAQEILDYAEKRNSGITILTNVDRTEMHHIDIHLVSLLEKWAHVCVPSKAVSAICSGSPILFFGTQQCDNWELLGDAGWLIRQTDNPVDISIDVCDFLTNVSTGEIAVQESNAARIAEKLQHMVDVGYSQVAAHLLGQEFVNAATDNTATPSVATTNPVPAALSSDSSLSSDHLSQPHLSR